MRQLADAGGDITLGQSLRPFGEVMESAGSGSSAAGLPGSRCNGVAVPQSEILWAGGGEIYQLGEFPA